MDPQEFSSQTRIEQFQEMPQGEFDKKYSVKTNPPQHFSDPTGHFTTNEYDYPKSLPEIKVRGGIHLAVMGGVDPVLGQIAVANPDLTVMTDINSGSVKTTTEGRLTPISESNNGAEYWERVKNYFKDVIRKADPKRWDFPSDQDVLLGGWSSSGNFAKVKEAFERGKIKLVSGDLTTDGIDLALNLAKETGIPVRLIYVSNIFDYNENKNRKAEFIQKLSKGIEDGTIDKDAQVIDTGLGEGISTQVLDISTYLKTDIKTPNSIVS